MTDEAPSPPYDRGPARAAQGMVVSESRLAGEAGVEVMRAGGNAVDGAVAAAFALAVASPWGGNLAGGTLAVVRREDGRLLALDGRETAPGAARPGMFLGPEGEVVEGLSTRSFLAAAVPGTVDALLRLWADHGSGRVDRERLLAPAVRGAREGVPVSPDLARRLNAKREHLASPAAARIFHRPDGRDWRTGDLLVQTDLARVLEAIAVRGREGLHGGWVAERIDAVVREGGGILSLRDLAEYRSRYREPVRGPFRGRNVVSVGPPSGGGPLLIHLLRVLESFPLEDLGWNTTRYLHLLAEAMHRAFADRAELIADPDFVSVPLARLLSGDYARTRAAEISWDRATSRGGIGPGLPLPAAPETTHLSAVDDRGNAVALTTTLNAGFGSGLVVEGTGLLLNNEMDDFALAPGTPNMFHLIEGRANAIAPGKRMLSSMTPAIILDDDRPVLVVGSPGGPRITTAVLQVVLNALGFDLPLPQAVAAPRIHAQATPHIVYVEESGLGPEIMAGLSALGHDVRVFPEGPIGRISAVGIDAQGILAGPDLARGDGAAAGF